MAHQMEGLIRLDGLALAFEREGTRTEVLRDLDLTIERGEFLALVGPSGVGKSTILRVIAGLAKPSAGRIAIAPRADGTPSSVAMVFQDARLLPWRRVIDNVAFGLERTRLGKAARRARALEMLDLVRLEALADRYPHELSGGQRQRVALARALAVDPDVLLMDEPFSALDPVTRHTLQDELVRIRAATAKTVLFVTHDIDEAVYLADRAILLSGSPARIADDRRIELPHPRLRDHQTLVAATEHIHRRFAGESYADGDGV